MSEPRPKFNPEIAMRAALATADDLIRNGHIEASERAEAARQIAEEGRGPYTNGYTLAKRLDDYHYWDCNLEIAECLDGFSSNVCDEIDRAEKEWAERNNVVPPLPVGSRVNLRGGETGEITEVYKHGAAKFLVKIDGDPDAETKNARRVVNFEDVTLATIDVGVDP